MADNNEPDADTMKDSEDQEPLTKRVVVTYSGIKRQKKDDMPPEIVPETPSHIVSSPVETEASPTLQVQDGEWTTAELSPIQPQQPQTPIQKPLFTAQSPIQPQAAPIQQPLFTAQPPIDEPPIPPGGGSLPPSIGPSSSSHFGRVVTSLLSIAVIGLLWNAYTDNQELAYLKSQTLSDKDSVSSIAEKAHLSLRQLDHLEKQQLQQQNYLQGLQKDLTLSQARLLSLSGTKEWVLAEAHYLTMMANNRLTLEKDIPTALEQLKAAKKRLEALADPSLNSAKEALTKDIGLLSAFPHQDKNKLWEQVSQLLVSLEQLEFKTVHAVTSNTTSLTQTEIPRWKRSLILSWNEIKSLIRVTHVDENKIPLALSMQDKAQILRTLQLMVEQIKWAVLQDNNSVYLNTLDDLNANVLQYFEQNAQQQETLKSISILTKNPLINKIPSLSSLETLNLLMLPSNHKSPLPMGGKTA